MSETPAAEPQGTPAAAPPTAPPAPPTAPAQETDWKAEARKWEDRAKENSKAKDRLAEIEAASMTEAQKLTARAETAEAKVKEFETEKTAAALRTEVSKATGVPADALRGNTKEELEAHAATLKALIAPADGKRPAVGPYVPPEGTAPGGAVQSPGDQFAEFIDAQLKRP